MSNTADSNPTGDTNGPVPRWPNPYELFLDLPNEDDDMIATALLTLFLSDPAEAPRPVVDYPIADSSLGKPLNENKTAFLDREGGRVWLKTRVARDAGVLEMLLCKTGTKEHESVVAVESPAFVIHAGLLALDLEPGQPAQFDPEFTPPQGPELAITCHWLDADGKKQSRPAAEWIRQVTHRWFATPLDPAIANGIEISRDLDLRYIEEDKELIWFGPMNEQMEAKLCQMSDRKEWKDAIRSLRKQTGSKPFQGRWIFAGSGYWVDEESGSRHYLAESGNLICVANFGDAMIDIDVQSSAENDSLLFEPWTERVPQPGTAVLLEIRPAESDTSTDSIE